MTEGVNRLMAFGRVFGECDKLVISSIPELVRTALDRDGHLLDQGVAGGFTVYVVVGIQLGNVDNDQQPGPAILRVLRQQRQTSVKLSASRHLSSPISNGIVVMQRGGDG